MFLAGGITGCEDWQPRLVTLLDDASTGEFRNLVVFNPRRENFPIGDPTAAEAQIQWEYEHLSVADMVSFWFAGGDSLQPITMLEFGRWTGQKKPIVVGCDPTYKRRQDVEIQHKLARSGHVWEKLSDVAMDIKRQAADLYWRRERGAMGPFA